MLYFFLCKFIIKTHYSYIVSWLTESNYTNLLCRFLKCRCHDKRGPSGFLVHLKSLFFPPSFQWSTDFSRIKNRQTFLPFLVNYICDGWKHLQAPHHQTVYTSDINSVSNMENTIEAKVIIDTLLSLTLKVKWGKQQRIKILFKEFQTHKHASNMLMQHKVLPVETIRRRKATRIMSAPVNVCVRGASSRVCVPVWDQIHSVSWGGLDRTDMRNPSHGGQHGLML